MVTCTLRVPIIDNSASGFVLPPIKISVAAPEKLYYKGRI